ncbi:MAG: hypothetical protein ACK58O_09465 [Brevundimonas sp.]
MRLEAVRKGDRTGRTLLLGAGEVCIGGLPQLRKLAPQFGHTRQERLATMEPDLAGAAFERVELIVNAFALGVQQGPEPVGQDDREAQANLGYRAFERQRDCDAAQNCARLDPVSQLKRLLPFAPCLTDVRGCRDGRRHRHAQQQDRARMSDSHDSRS